MPIPIITEGVAWNDLISKLETLQRGRELEATFADGQKLVVQRTRADITRYKMGDGNWIVVPAARYVARILRQGVSLRASA